MLIKVKVKFSQNFNIINHKDYWEVHLTESPENNRANKQLLKELRKQYKSVRLIWGLKSKNKILEIDI